MHRLTLLEVSDEITALCLAELHAVSLQAFHHVHLEHAASVVVLSVDHSTSQVSEGRSEEWSYNWWQDHTENVNKKMN